MNGKVAWYDSVRGYGFISPEGGGKDLFVHVSALERADLDDLVKGQRVSFDVSVEREKPAAVNLRLIEVKACPR